MNERVRYEVIDGVADVKMVRSEKLNALDQAMFSQLIATGEELAGRSEVRAVVLSGDGRAFCAGLDMASFAQMGQPSEERSVGLMSRPGERTTNDAQYACWVWAEMPVPTIAAITGVAFGGGCQLALAADIRIAAPDARMSVMEIKWGLVPDMTGTQVLPGLVGIDVAKELTFTGRIVEAAEADSIGMVTRIAEDPHLAAMDLAREIASKNPTAIRYSKRLLDSAGKVPLGVGFALEAELQAATIGTANQTEAVMANFEKRSPNFADHCDPDSSGTQ